VPDAALQPFKIIDETPEWIVVDKPALLQIHPSKPDGKFTLWHAMKDLLAFEIANGGQVSIINRLDRETSGLVLIAKTPEAARKFGMLMMRRKIAKEYLALVWGWPERDRFEIDAPIARQGAHGVSPIYLKQCVHPAGSEARTIVEVEKRIARETSNGGRFALVRVFPETGRMHQIRVHLAHIGHPVVGDKIYGPDEQNYLRFIETGWTDELAHTLLLQRHALHSAALKIDGADFSAEWRAPLPDDFAPWLQADAQLSS
jgi:23S rRNA pseudouridine1911/1915/1917 synthase